MSSRPAGRLLEVDLYADLEAAAKSPFGVELDETVLVDGIWREGVDGQVIAVEQVLHREKQLRVEPPHHETLLHLHVDVIDRIIALAVAPELDESRGLKWYRSSDKA